LPNPSIMQGFQFQLPNRTEEL